MEGSGFEISEGMRLALDELRETLFKHFKARESIECIKGMDYNDLIGMAVVGFNSPFFERGKIWFWSILPFAEHPEMHKGFMDKCKILVKDLPVERE